LEATGLVLATLASLAAGHRAGPLQDGRERATPGTVSRREAKFSEIGATTLLNHIQINHLQLCFLDTNYHCTVASNNPAHYSTSKVVEAMDIPDNKVVTH
jgi:hypothetical protein